MSLTAGIQGASATPATDFYTNVLSPKLTALGWTYIEQITAATAGTTDVVEIWKTAATTVSGTIHTGCILYIETDNTNARIRIRVSEVYDTSVSGTPASRVKWAAAGITTSTTSTTPAASYAMADTFGPLFVTAGTTSKVGWVNIPMSVNGFGYWVGGGASRFLVANNSGGFSHFCLAGGPIETLVTAVVDTTSVYLIGGQTATGGADPSYTLTTSDCGNVRTSREPQIVTASQAGAFCWTVGRAIPVVPPINTSDAMGAIAALLVPPHKFHNAIIVSPAVIHGITGATFNQGRSHRAVITGMIVVNGVADGQIPGDTITVGGTVYTIVGGSPHTSSVYHYAVDASVF